MNFNPHPVRRPGATRPGPRTPADYLISILTRCEDRVLRRIGWRSGNCRKNFNPHPVRRPGATLLQRPRRKTRPDFNPHPVRRPGATLSYILCLKVTNISILTRCEDRVLRPHTVRYVGVRVFQSSPGAKTGCYKVRETEPVHYSIFQSSPGAKTGCYSALADMDVDKLKISILTRCEDRVLRQTRQGYTALHNFNPHPVRRPGATYP